MSQTWYDKSTNIRRPFSFTYSPSVRAVGDEESLNEEERVVSREFHPSFTYPVCLKQAPRREITNLSVDFWR